MCISMFTFMRVTCERVVKGCCVSSLHFETFLNLLLFLLICHFYCKIFHHSTKWFQIPLVCGSSMPLKNNLSPMNLVSSVSTSTTTAAVECFSIDLKVNMVRYCVKPKGKNKQTNKHCTDKLQM